VTVPAALVLSLFPGVDLLGRAFGQAGFCVVTGPELLFGSRVEDFRGLAGRFDGIIAGPPCQDFSSARRNEPTGDGVRLLREFLRVVAECRPTWWLAENVPAVPDLRLDGYQVQRFDLWDVECGGIQARCRHIQFGHRSGWILRPKRRQLSHTGMVRFAVTGRSAILASQYGERSFREHCRRQGLEGSFRAPGLRPRPLWWAIGNGVPMTMGRTLAEAVLSAGPRDPARDCLCGCGRSISGRRINARHATPACRKRMERLRRGARYVVTYP
jgi:DNA (cytosine-5)-methyltransferase 1